MQGGVALLDLPKHLVEAVDERADFILATLESAQGIILVLGYRPRGFGQIQNGLGEHTLETQREKKGKEPRGQQENAGDRRVSPDARIEGRETGVEADGADDLAVQADGPFQHQRLGGETDLANAHRGPCQSMPAAALVFSEDFAAGNKNPGRLDGAFGAEHGQVVLGAFLHAILHRRGAVVGHEVGQGGQVFHHGRPKSHDLVSHKPPAGQQQGHATGQHDDQHLLAGD